MEARALQRLLYYRACQAKVTDASLAVLARSWCLVQDCIRVMRGIPSPGQLRPDLDPVQLAKALKRSRTRKPIDVLTQMKQLVDFSEAEAAEGQPAAEKKAKAMPMPKAEEKTTESKESLLPKGGVATG